MGALLAVAQGSVEEPRFIALEYNGADGAPVVLVGKGVTFDTGGISIKPAAEHGGHEVRHVGRRRGARHVRGARPAQAHGARRRAIPSTENMPSGTAVKPGDVITSLSGKTIEVINTDAEGRLILCDALAYARRYQPALRARHRDADRRHRRGARPHARAASWAPTTR